MTNNTDADIRAEFEKDYTTVTGKEFYNYDDRGPALINGRKAFMLYKAGIEKGKRIENEKMIGLAESILTIYAPYGLSDAQIKVLAKSSVDDYMRSINTSKD